MGTENSPPRSRFGLFRPDEAGLQLLLQPLRIATDIERHRVTQQPIEVRRRRVLEAAYVAHPERFKGRLPTPRPLPEIVGINLPRTQSTETTNGLIATPASLTNSENPVSQSHCHIPEGCSELRAIT